MRWYDPWEEMRRLQEEMDGIFGKLMTPRYRRMLPGESEGKKDVVPFSEPAADVISNGDEMKVIVDLPGIEKEDLMVTVRERSVHIKAEKKTESTEEDKGYYFQERGYIGYQRTIPLPDEAIPDKTEAEYNNGVLELTIKKANPAKLSEFKVDFK